jgi:phasin family protein
MLQSNDASFGLYRSALKSAVDMTALYLSGVERLQSAQAEAFREICAEQAEVASKLESIQSIEELQTVQSGYTRHQMERLGDYWRGLFTNTCQSQMEFLKEAQAKARQATESLNQNLDSTHNLPAVSAMKMFVDAAHSAYAAGLRVTEQAAAMTATQMDAGKNAAAAAIGQVNGKSRRAAA